MKTLSRFLALALAFAAGGAHAVSDDDVAATFQPPPRDATILLLVEKADSSPLDRAGAMLEKQLQKQLADDGYRTAVLDIADYQALEAAEAAALGEHPHGKFIPASSAAKANALSKLARIAKSESHCDMLIRARIVERKAALGGQYAEWDGRRRGLIFEGANDLDVANGGHSRVVSVNVKGSTTVLSVELVAFDGTGARDFVTHGAVVVPLVWNLKLKSTSVRTDLFQTDEDVADGLQIALAPMRGKR